MAGFGSGAVASKKMGLGGIAGIGFAAFDVSSNLKDGDGLPTAVVKSAATTAMFAMAPWTMGTLQVGELAASGASAYVQHQKTSRDNFRQMNGSRGVVGGNYIDTNRALTMRQASVQAIQGSKMNARSALGGEARIMSRGQYWG